MCHPFTKKQWEGWGVIIHPVSSLPPSIRQQQEGGGEDCTSTYEQLSGMFKGFMSFLSNACINCEHLPSLCLGLLICFYKQKRLDSEALPDWGKRFWCTLVLKSFLHFQEKVLILSYSVRALESFQSCTIYRTTQRLQIQYVFLGKPCSIEGEM